MHRHPDFSAPVRGSFVGVEQQELMHRIAHEQGIILCHFEGIRNLAVNSSVGPTKIRWQPKFNGHLRYAA